jgi:hypothetical protein
MDFFKMACKLQPRSCQATFFAKVMGYILLWGLLQVFHRVVEGGPLQLFSTYTEESHLFNPREDHQYVQQGLTKGCRRLY